VVGVMGLALRGLGWVVGVMGLALRGLGCWHLDATH
jgi:hypothetical protein